MLGQCQGLGRLKKCVWYGLQDPVSFDAEPALRAMNDTEATDINPLSFSILYQMCSRNVYHVNERIS